MTFRASVEIADEEPGGWCSSLREATLSEGEEKRKEKGGNDRTGFDTDKERTGYSSGG